MFGPYNYTDRLPKKMRAWFNEHAQVDYHWGPLPGEFALTKIQLHAYYITRYDYEPKAPTQVPSASYALDSPLAAIAQGQRQQPDWASAKQLSMF